MQIKFIAKTEEEIQNWFLNHSSGDLPVMNENGHTKLCSTYKEAMKWLKTPKIKKK